MRKYLPLKTLRVWTGPVHSGKSKKALTLAKRMVRLGSDVVLVRPGASIRKHELPGYLVTKDGDKWPALDLRHPSEMMAASKGASVLWLDEPSLFEDEALVFNAIMKIRRRTQVMVSGICSTSELTVFGESMPKIIAVADYLVWCKADCDMCRSLNKATRSFYKHGHKKRQVKVGGEDDYLALCPSCWNKRMN